MSSRQEEKERRKRERQEREAAEKAKVARKKRMQMVFGGVLGLGAVAALIVVLVVVVLGGDDADDVPVGAAASIPAQQEGDVEKAAELASCTYEPKVPNEGAGHEEKDFKASDYKQNPPTSGNHFPEWYEDGIYSAGDTPELGKLVHTLEHGRINVQYKPGTPADTVAQLESLLAEQNDGYHMLLYENTTDMTAQVAATTWGHSLTCPEMNDQVFDALRTFRNEYIDQGPEDVP
jgi:hypothetical protein